MTRAVIAVGANLGDREETIAAAARAIADADGVELVAVSPLYETPAVRTDGVDPDAPRYLNGVLLVETSLAPTALLDLLQRIEDAHGRTRETRWGDRTLDLDLIDHGGVRLADERLELPHPRAWQRAFVLQPWLDVDPDAEIPGRGRVDALRAAARDEVVRR
ncbi:2-amino-4-hydroxy-6-hydroxymethyldihydropteridine diphosphokinase [Agromyces sp. SYSU T0242]|uniref:2-amino-4-hydroxy-6- hydroxymethyldihydropteridine diphosphokinase n=1 Tax=Agromyces litoreus TaxID=3158561 RepID=UPI0033962954